jgi:glycine hydroxymethyltransferase
MVPGGVRLGAPALTSRGFKEADFEKVVDFIDEAVQIASEAKRQTKKLKDYNDFLDSDSVMQAKCKSLKSRVIAFAETFPMPGFDNH